MFSLHWIQHFPGLLSHSSVRVPCYYCGNVTLHAIHHVSCDVEENKSVKLKAPVPHLKENACIWKRNLTIKWPHWNWPMILNTSWKRNIPWGAWCWKKNKTTKTHHCLHACITPWNLDDLQKQLLRVLKRQWVRPLQEHPRFFFACCLSAEQHHPYSTPAWRWGPVVPLIRHCLGEMREYWIDHPKQENILIDLFQKFVIMLKHAPGS